MLPTAGAACRRFAELGGIAAEAVGLIPKVWEVEEDARRALVEFIEQRAAFLAETLEDRLFDPPQMTMADLTGGEL